MADNYDSGNGENGNEFNSSSLLDNSLGAKYDVCTGPVTDGEKAYLLRHGLALEDSRGELYGEPSTIIDFEDSLVVDEPEPLVPQNTPTTKANQELRRSSRKSRATTPCIKCKLDSVATPKTPMASIEGQMSQLALQDKENIDKCCSEVENKIIAKNVDQVNSPATPAYKSTPKQGSKRFNTDSTPVLNQSCRVTRASVKRNTELMLLTSLNVQDQGDESIIDSKEKQDKDNEHAELKRTENVIISDIENDAPGSLPMAVTTEPSAAPVSPSPIPEAALAKDGTLSPSAPLENCMASQISSEQKEEDASNRAAATEEVNESEIAKIAEVKPVEPATLPQNQDELEGKTNNTGSELENVSSVTFNSTYSISSGDEFDDTITRMEKLLAMADEQEKINIEAPVEAALAEKNTEELAQTETLSTKSPCRVVKKSSMTPAREGVGSAQKTQPPIPMPHVLASMARRSGISAATPTGRGRTPSPLVRAPIPTPTGSGEVVGTKKITPLTSRVQTGITPTSTKVTPMRPKIFGSGLGIKTAYFGTPSPRPAPVPLPVGSTTKTTKTTSPFPIPTVGAGTLFIGAEKNIYASPVKSNIRKDGGEIDAIFKTPEPSPLFRGKKGAYFKSPPSGLASAHKERVNPSVSTPILQFAEPRSIHDTIASPVSTIYPSPVKRPTPIQIAKIGKGKPASPLAMLKSNYKAVSSPVAEYIYSTPNPMQIKRVIKTSDNTKEKKPPFRAGGVSSLPRRSGIPRLTAMTAFPKFPDTGAGTCGFTATATKARKESLQNQQAPNPNEGSPAQGIDGETNPQHRQLKAVHYQGSDRIREQLIREAPGTSPKDLRVQIHKGIVDTNTNATIVEDASVKKSFIPARVRP